MAKRAKAQRKRWHVAIKYRTRTIPTQQFDLEDLFDLHDLIERGPDWNHIRNITVTLNNAKA
jgi:hypothetical protein